jgi:hypothetical protein
MKTSDLPQIRSSYGEVFGVGLWTVLRKVASETDLYIAAEEQPCVVDVNVDRILWNIYYLS